MKNDRPGPDPEIVAALRRLGEQHEPDSDAIWARVDPSRAAAPARVVLDGRRDRTDRSLVRTAQARPAPRSPRRPRFAGAVAVSLAAASVLGVFGLTQAVTRRPVTSAPVATTLPTIQDDIPQTTGPDSPRPPVLGSAASTSRPEPSGRPPGATESPDRGAGQGTPSSPADRPTDPPTAGDPPAPGFPAPSTAPLGSDTEVTLTTDVYVDWVSLGARNDIKQVRAKRPLGGPALTVDAPAGSEVTSSPLSVSWTDGYTEQSRTDARTWIHGSSGGSWVITVQRGDTPRRLVVLAGAATGGFRVDASSPDGLTGSWAGANPAGSDPFTLSMEIPGGTGPVTVTLTAAQQDGLSVAAVTLQRI